MTDEYCSNNFCWSVILVMIMHTISIYGFYPLAREFENFHFDHSGRKSTEKRQKLVQIIITKISAEPLFTLCIYFFFLADAINQLLNFQRENSEYNVKNMFLF